MGGKWKGDRESERKRGKRRRKRNSRGRTEEGMDGETTIYQNH